MGVENGSNLSGTEMPGFANAEASCRAPSEQVILWDSQNPWADFNGGFWPRDIENFRIGNHNYGHWHNGQANFLFQDGHVKTNRFDRMKFENFFNCPEGDPRYGTTIMQPYL
jgi:prepilin-type processing-associated H-X9-DG protein